MKRSIVGTCVALVLCAASLVGPASASATPYNLTPTAGALVASNAQVFSWDDNQAQGPVDHWYMEISTQPAVDRYYFGYFVGGLVYASEGDLMGSSVNLNGLGRALAPGTYYWHVCGYYGPYGSLGTAWSPVQSFTIHSSTAIAPKIGVNPSSFTYVVNYGDVSVHELGNLAVSNIGGGTLSVWYANDTNSATWLWWEDGSFTQYVWTIPIKIRATSDASWNASPLHALPVGTYTTSFTLIDAGSNPAATNSPKYVPVTLRVVSSDRTAPTGTVSIAGGAAGTRTPDVVLTLAATDGGTGVGEMRFSGYGGWTEWARYATTKAWRLSEGDGTKTVQVQFRDRVGNVSATASDTIVLDTVAPGKTTLTAPAVSTDASRTASFPLSWTATDAAPSAGVSYRLYYRALPATTWTAWGSYRTSTTGTFPGTQGKTYQFRARARDGAGNLGAYSDTQKTTVPLNDTTATLAGAWTTTSQASAYFGKVKATRARGASATFKAIGARYSLLVTTGPGRSKAKVYVDGRYTKTIDTAGDSMRCRQIVEIKSFASAGSHTIRVVNAATAGRTLLNIDGLVAAR